MNFSATEYHLGVLKAKLAKYRMELIEIKSGTSGKGEGFDVMKSGDARVALMGFPSVGKSTLLNKITATSSAVAAYEFTTLTCIPGNIYYQGATIQLLDLPGIIEGASQGRGRGKQVIAVARTADLILMMLDATKGDQQRSLLERELEAVGIRLNRPPPNIYFKSKNAGGVAYTATVKQSALDDKLVQKILHEYKIYNCEVIVREDATIDQFIDTIVGGRKYISCLYVYNKIDSITVEEVDRLARLPYSIVASCEMGLNLDCLIEAIWEQLGMLRIYTKKRAEIPDFREAVILRHGATIEHLCHRLHRNLVNVFKYAMVWGSSAKHQPQKVGLSHCLDDQDVVQIVKKS